ncbi:MAG: DUF4440 domain-containing protein [Ignavibacteriaceae bacterium]
MKYFKYLLLFLIPLLFISCSQPAKFDSAAAKKAIDNGNALLSNSLAKGDIQSIANLYTEDAIALPPNSEMLEGRDSIKTFWESVTRMGLVNIHLTTTDITGSGNIAVETGNYKLEIYPEGKEAINDHGKYLVIWQEQKNNSWEIIRDMWNSDVAPVPSAGK